MLVSKHFFGCSVVIPLNQLTSQVELQDYFEQARGTVG